jgi:O-antigen/teichoic acid export membrane protein
MEELASTAWSSFKAALQNQATLVLVSVPQILFLCVTVGLIALGVDSLLLFLTARFMVALSGAIAAIIVLVHLIGLEFDWRLVRPTLGQALPFAASMALALIYGRADIVIVGQWLGEEQAGLYAPASTLVTALFLIPAAIYGVMLPVLSRVHAAEQAPALQRITRQFLAVSATMGVILGGSVALMADPIVRIIYGEAFGQSAAVLAILGGVLFLRCIVFSLAAIIVAVGWQKWRVMAQVAAATLSIGLNLLIVNQWGILGVAKVYVVTEAVLVVGYLSLVVWWQRSQARSMPLAST